MPVVLVDALAKGVLEDPVVALARQVAEGGDHKLLRAIELAEMVMRSKGSEGEREADRRESVGAVASH